MKTIIIYGIRRSGNHFLISTILQQFTNYVHINDASHLSIDTYNKYKNIPKTVDRIDIKYTGFKNTECVVISLENKEIDFNLVNQFNDVDNCYFVILLRCPYGNFSSIWKSNYKNIFYLNKIKNLWRDYANIFITTNKFIKVLYDEYATNHLYITTILTQLGINIKQIDENRTIMYQNSSFQDKSKSRKTYVTLNSCIFHDDVNFINKINDDDISNQWNIIKTRYHID